MTFDRNNPKWTDWKWQHSNSCKDFDTLRTWLQDSGHTLSVSKELLTQLIDHYRMGITPYYFNLIRHFDHSDPIYRQIVPAKEELIISPDELEDPIGDENPSRGSRPLKALIHRYSNRVLLIPTAQCAVYCRFCFRKRLVGEPAHNAREEDLQAAYSYIEEHKEIEEVILTGGDPLTLGDDQLAKILERLDQVDHLRVIRIHTRLPVVNPFRLTQELGQIIGKIRTPVWVSTHFNHVNEITAIAEEYISRWVNMGIPFLNQSVLLKGVNDSTQNLKMLFMRLIEIKLKPYYLHQADLVQGTSHLRVPIEKGLKLLHDLQGNIPGYAIPHYVLDSPTGEGKVPLQNTFDLNH